VIDQNLYNWAPLVLFVPALLFVADWSLTLIGARAYRTVSDRWSVEGSYEMNPAWEAAVESGRWFNPRILVVSLFYFVITAALWIVARGIDYQLGDPPVALPGLFAFGVGLILLVQAPTLMNHAANLLQFRSMADPSSSSGHIHFSRWLAQLETGWVYFRFAALWLVLGVVSFQLFFLGGALGCLVTGYRFWRTGTKTRATPPDAVLPPMNVDVLRAAAERDGK
jgi:hypothetical protein